MGIKVQVPKSILITLNQLFELERKLNKADDSSGLGRNITKIKDAFREEGLPLNIGGVERRLTFAYEDPTGEPFNETRSDLDASISGSGTDNLVVVEVIKPVIRYILNDQSGMCSKIIQKGIVIVESQKGK
ncbi:MAG: hypothetical protein WCI64_10720 [Chlorobium sp.]